MLNVYKRKLHSMYGLENFDNPLMNRLFITMLSIMYFNIEFLALIIILKLEIRRDTPLVFVFCIKDM